ALDAVLDFEVGAAGDWAEFGSRVGLLDPPDNITTTSTSAATQAPDNPPAVSPRHQRDLRRRAPAPAPTPTPTPARAFATAAPPGAGAKRLVARASSSE